MAEQFSDRYDYLANTIIQFICGGGFTDWDFVPQTDDGYKGEVLKFANETPGIPPWITSTDDILSVTPIVGQEQVNQALRKFKHHAEPSAVQKDKNGQPAIILVSARVDLRDYIKASVAYGTPVSTIMRDLADIGVDRHAFRLAKEYLKTHYHEMGTAMISSDTYEVDTYPTNPSDTEIERISKEMDDTEEPAEEF